MDGCSRISDWHIPRHLLRKGPAPIHELRRAGLHNCPRNIPYIHTGGIREFERRIKELVVEPQPTQLRGAATMPLQSVCNLYCS